MIRLQTYSGQLFDVLQPDHNKINIEDIAHSLALQCRYGGHCKEFYSVAQHSVIVSENVSKKNAMWGLFHDASEAYVTDIPSPLKHCMPDFNIWEKAIQIKIAKTFNLPIYSSIYPKEVKNIDKAVLATEEMQLMKQHIKWENNYKPIKNLKIKPIIWEEAKKMFLRRYMECTSF